MPDFALIAEPATEVIICFPPMTSVLNCSVPDMFEVAREMGMLPIWQTMQVEIDRENGNRIIFDTSFKLPEYHA